MAMTKRKPFSGLNDALGELAENTRNTINKAKLYAKQPSYQSSLQGRLADITDKILNREKFSYDLNGDAFYNQYKDKFTQQGKMAMMDTMAQAAALTGGYGSSYAQQVGQQAYHGYLENLNDVVPELYQLAMDNYDREGNTLLQQYGLLAEQEAQAYNRHRDAVADRQYLDQLEYQRERDAVEDARYQEQVEYQKEQDAKAESQWREQFEEAKRQYNDQNNRAYESFIAEYAGDGEGGEGVEPPEPVRTQQAEDVAISIRNNADNLKGSEKDRASYIYNYLNRNAGGLTDGEMQWIVEYFYNLGYL